MRNLGGKIYKAIKKKFLDKKNLDPKAGYNLWAQSYDGEKTNLMHLIDERVISQWLSKGILVGKTVADFGCGTGRNWPYYLKASPLKLIGFDVSEEMLNLLKVKFPEADTFLIQPDQALPYKEDSVDIIISTLVIEHIRDIELLFENWSRIIRADSEIMITGYHPTGIQNGGVVSFTIEKKTHHIVKYSHNIDQLAEVALKHKFKLISLIEIKIDEQLKPYYQDANALNLYEKHKETPLYFAIHFKRIC